VCRMIPYTIENRVQLGASVCVMGGGGSVMWCAREQASELCIPARYHYCIIEYGVNMWNRLIRAIYHAVPEAALQKDPRAMASAWR